MFMFTWFLMAMSVINIISSIIITTQNPFGKRVGVSTKCLILTQEKFPNQQSMFFYLLF